MAPTDRHPADPRRLSFGADAAAYDRYRPSFPEAALAWGLGHVSSAVVDVGAGTGLMTEALLRAGHQVIAVEPDPRMRDQLRVRLGPAADVRAGSAEALPLPDGSVDAIVSAESFHWFDRRAALAELGRVIRPGGTFMIVWNVRDEREPWVRELSRLLDPLEPRTGAAAEGLPDVGPWFTVVDEARFSHEHHLDSDRLVGLVATYSSVRTSPRRDHVLDQVAQLARGHPDLAGRTTFALPLRTRVVRCTPEGSVPAV